MSEAQSSDAMYGLMKFFICLAILGTLMALAGYFLWPAALPAPSNAMVGAGMEII